MNTLETAYLNIINYRTIKQKTLIYKATVIIILSFLGNIWSAPEVSVIQVPVVPVEMTAQSSPAPVKIMDEVPRRCTPRVQKQRKLMPTPRLSQGTTISLYELMQFSNISTTYIPPISPNDPLRRNSWEIGELIPGLGVRISIVSVTFTSLSRSQQIWNEFSGSRGIIPNPGSAFTPVTGVANQNILNEPLLVVIDDTSLAGSMYFQPGQIILEVNGVNLYSVPVTSKQGLLTRLIAAVFNACNNGDGSLFLTLATPYPHLVRRTGSESMEISLN